MPWVLIQGYHVNIAGFHTRKVLYLLFCLPRAGYVSGDGVKKRTSDLILALKEVCLFLSVR